jgi:hypothetical protein
VAPLGDFESVDWTLFARNLLGSKLGSEEGLSLSGIKARRLALEASSKTCGLVDVQGADGLCAPLMVGALSRNVADFSSARPGELVSLDGLRGASAMLLGKCSSIELAESEFSPAWHSACSAAQCMLGDRARGWRGSSWIKGPASLVEHPMMERAWPPDIGAWEAMWRASEDAREIGQAIGPLAASAKRAPKAL